MKIPVEAPKRESAKQARSPAMNHPDQVNDRDGVHADTRTPSLIRAPDEFDLVVEGAAEQVTDPATDGAQRDVEVNVAVHGLRKYGAGLAVWSRRSRTSTGIYKTCSSTTAGSAHT